MRTRLFEQLERREVLSVNWADTFGSGEGGIADFDSARDLAVGPDGSSYVAGAFNDDGTIDFDDQSDDGDITRRKRGGRDEMDGFLVKYDQNGAFQWVVHATNGFRAYVNEVAVDSQGNAYIAGGFNEPFDLYRNDALQATVSGMGVDIFLAKISSDGNVEWVKTVAGDRGYKIPHGIEVLEDPSTGDVEMFLWGMAANGGDLDPGPGTTLDDAVDGDRHGFLGKYNYDAAADALTLDWFAARETGTLSGWLNEIDVAQDEVIGVGSTETQTFVGIFDVATGQLLEEELSSSAATRGGVDRVGRDIYMSGNFTGAVDLNGDGTVDLAGNNAQHGFVGKYALDDTKPFGEMLSLVWASPLDGDDTNRLLDVKTSPSGEIYAAGQFAGTVNVNGAPLQSAGERDGLVVEFDAQSGALMAAYGFGGADFDQARILEVDAEGAIHTIGDTNSLSVTFPNVSSPLVTDGTQNGFISVFTPVTSAPPIADAGPSQSGVEDQVLTFDASGSTDPDGDSLTYRWDFGDGEMAETTSPTVSNAYAYGGTFDVILTVLDGSGGVASDTTTATVTEVNDLPVADAGGPYAGFATQAVTLDASGSSDFDNLDGTAVNDQTLTYIWTFGDGTTLSTSSVTVTHTYATAGNYSVELEVSDGIASSLVSSTTAAIQDAPTGDPSAIYVWNIDDDFETRQRGRHVDHRVVLTVRNDSDGDGVAELTDAGIANVQVTVELRDSVGNLMTTLTGTTDSNGVFRSQWVKQLVPGDYRVEVTDLALAGYSWDPWNLLDATVNDDDQDGDGRPDELLTV